MKKITLLLFVLGVSLGYSQTDVIENFDGAAPGLAPDNGECTPIGLAIGTTQSTDANSLEIIAQAAGNPWQGAQVIPQSNMMALTTNLNMTVDVYSDVPAGVLAKVTNGTGPDSAAPASHGGTGWETLSYDFSVGADNTAAANGIYSVIRFYPLWGTGGYSGQGTAGCVSNAPITIYVDNIIGTFPPMPTCDDGIKNGNETGIDCGGPDCDACLTPVILENFEGTAPTITTDWGLKSATITTDPAARAGGDVLEIVSGAAGESWQSANLLIQNNKIDLSTPDTTVSVDVYSTTATSVLAQVVDASATTSATDSAHGGTGWETLVFDFSDPKNSTGAADGQYGEIQFFPNWVGNGAGNNTTDPNWDDPVEDFTIYVDDITAVPAMALSSADFNFAQFTASPNPTSNKWNIKTNGQTIESVQMFDILGKQVMTLEPRSNEVSIDASVLPKGLYFAKMTTEVGSNSIKLIKN